jgi:hypothetical protein
LCCRGQSTIQMPGRSVSGRINEPVDRLNLM